MACGPYTSHHHTNIKLKQSCQITTSSSSSELAVKCGYGRSSNVISFLLSIIILSSCIPNSLQYKNGMYTTTNIRYNIAIISKIAVEMGNKIDTQSMRF